MDFELDDDQLALRDAARELLESRASSADVRVAVDRGHGFDPKLWAAMVDQGWTAIAVPGELGGLGLGWVELAVLLEQVGAFVAPAPILQHSVALALLVEARSPLVDALVSGDVIGAVAHTPVAAREFDGGWFLDGSTEPVVYAPSAGVVVVRSDDAVFVVGLEGIQPAAEPAMDRTREVGWLRFSSTPATRLGGPELVELMIDAGAVAYAAELLGVGGASLDLAVAYAKDREQFGRPIGSFQAVKHRCADMLVDVEGMRSVVYYAAWCLGADDRERSVAASTAKTWCSDAGRRVTASCLQVHGGIGFTWESDVHLYLKRAQLDEVSFGDAVYHRDRLATLLRARVDAGESVI
jgi:alkylation response protein AidB-like acyl-CoA dehydrogenase